MTMDKMAGCLSNLTPTPRMLRSVLSRRDFGRRAACAAGTAALAGAEPYILGAAETSRAFSLNYILGSPMYGTTPLAEVLAEAAKIGAEAIDVWPRRHANHREQMDEMGHDRVQRLLDEHRQRLGMTTRYDLGPYRLQEGMFGLEQITVTNKGHLLQSSRQNP
jgi:hypothetical protein